MAVHEGDDLLYVVDPGNGAVLKYDVSDPTNPALANFSALGSPALTEYDDDLNGGTAMVPLPLGGKPDIAVDSSGGPNDGTIYLVTGSNGFFDPGPDHGSFLIAFDAAGNYLYEVLWNNAESIDAVGVAIVGSGDRAGDLYVTMNALFSYTGPNYLHLADQPGGAPPVYDEASSFRQTASVIATADGGETIYGAPGLSAFGPGGGVKYTIKPSGTPVGLATDPDGGDLYAAGTSSFFGTVGTAIDRFAGATAADPGELLDSFGADATAVALRSSSSTVYASDAVAHEIDIYVPGEVPDLTIGEGSFDSLTSAELTGTVNPLGAAVSTCEFQYGTTDSYGQSVLCDPANLGNGEDPVDVSGIATGLTGGTQYHYRLKVTNADGTNVSEDATYFAPNLPEATTAEAGPTGARSGSVLLGGTVDANKTPTEWWIEYGVESDLSDGQSSPMSEDLDAGDGNNPIDVNHKVTGLAPETTYYFRVVAATKGGSDEGAIRSFETPAEPAPDPTDCANAEFRRSGSPSAALPNCRAYERVTPADTNGGSALVGYGITTADGNRVTYDSETGYAGQQSVGLTASYVAERGPDGWTSEGVQPPVKWNNVAGLALAHYRPQAVDSELDDFYVSVKNIGLPGVPGSGNSLAHRGPAGDWSLLATNTTVFPVVPRDGWVLTSSEADVTTTEGPQISAGAPGLYEINNDKSVVRLVSVDENDDPIPAGSVDVANDTGYQAVSDDGSRIFFEVSKGTFPGIPSLWVRIDGEETQELTESEVTPAPTITRAEFAGATPDARFAFFTANAALTSDSTATSAKPDLYRYDVESGDLTDLTIADPSGGGAEGTLGFSDDGQIVYFQATGNLTPDASGSGSKIYRLDGGGITLIAENIVRSPDPQVSVNATNYERDYLKQSAVSPDGRYVLFASAARYNVFDPDGYRQYYRYDAATGRTDCVSCSIAGLEPDQSAHLLQDVSFRIAPNTKALFGPHPRLTPDGKVVFASPDPLVARDTNNDFDVYIWGGEARLISSGTAVSGAWPTAMTEDGKSIFFISRGRLVAADADNKVDTYVARVDGGIEAQQSLPDRENLCQGPVCRNEEPPAPDADAPDTERSTPIAPALSCKSEQRKLDRAERKAKRAQRKAHRKDRKVKKLRRKARRADGKRAHKLRKRTKRARRKAKRLDRKAGRTDKREERAARRASRCLNGGAK